MFGQKLKGFWGEFKIKMIMFFFLGSGYKKFHNVTVEFSNKKTSQIDHVVVSRYGIFVIETKNYKGLIGVDEHSQQWTQSFRRNSYRFYNPIMQNEGHIRAMKYLLRNKDHLYFNVVCFVGDATFSDRSLPECVTKSIWSAMWMLRKPRRKTLSKQEVQQIASDIKKRRLPNNRRTHKRHLKNVKATQASYLEDQ